MTASISYISEYAERDAPGATDMDNVLLMDAKTLFGVYVVTDGIDSKFVVACSDNPESAYNQAIAKGVSDPVLVYVPTESEKTVVLWHE
jgi:hypothetical protein